MLVDLARYTDNAPKNQAVRDSIGTGLVELLDALHDCGRYDRVVVAAHSLGSIVAYDAIAYLWARKNKMHARSGRFECKALADVQRAACDLNLDPVRVEDYHDAQRAAWLEQRVRQPDGAGGAAHRQEQGPARRGVLPHGDASMPASARPAAAGRPHAHGAEAGPGRRDEPVPFSFEELAQSYRQGEWRFWWECEAHAPIIHHSAPFAVVRWTNIWNKADWFAGPLAGLFGPGIHDIRVKDRGWTAKFPVLAHTTYLGHDDRPGGAKPAIRHALDLESGGWLRPGKATDAASAGHFRTRTPQLTCGPQARQSSSTTSA